MVLFPSTLPQYFDKENFSKTRTRNLQSQTNGDGTINTRVLYTRPPVTINGQISLNKEQYSIFFNFFDVTLDSGTKPFYLEDPTTGLKTLMQFKSNPLVRVVEVEDFILTLVLEVYENDTI